MTDGTEQSVNSGAREEDSEIAVFIISKSATCAECGEEVNLGQFLRVEKEKPLCLACADLDALVYLPRGNTALTRRARKHSGLSAVVLKFSKSRGRYERQGVLVEAAALVRAEQECLGDEERRQLARERAAVQRDRADATYVAAFAEQIALRYPGCPRDEGESIAKHACEKSSGRVGRSAAAKDFDPTMIDLAVRAHVRHAHTSYDSLLSKGWDRTGARTEVSDTVREVLRRWGQASQAD